MENHKNKSTNNDIDYTIKTEPKDGIVHKKHIEPVNIDNIGKYHKGYTTTKVFTTSDPKATRPFAYGICAVFLIIGLFLLLLKSWFMGTIFTSVAIYSFVSAKNSIDKLAAKSKKQGKNITFESRENVEEVTEEAINFIKENIKEVNEDTFTPEKINWFIKYTLPIYCLITIVLFVFISIAVNIVLGLLILGICILVGIVYYFILSKICKK